MGKGRNTLAVTQHCSGYHSDKCTKDIVHTQAASFKWSIESVDFYPCDAMLARVIAIATCLSVCPSVRLSHAGIVSKRRKLAA